MSNDAAGFVGSIPHYYDQGLGPIIFAEYADDIAQRTAAAKPARVLETAGTRWYRSGRNHRRADTGISSRIWR
jgi:hypothetical protein